MKIYYQIKLSGRAYAFLTSILTFLLILQLPTVVQAQTITGTVYRDFNADGTYVAVPNSGTYAYGEPGVAGVIVTAYSANSATAPVSATTTSKGTYTLTVGSTTAYRVEFTNLPVGDYETARGTNSSTSIQFVNGGSSGVNLGTNLPEDYCQANPKMVIPCYENGSGVGNTNPVLVSLDYTDTGTGQNTYPTNTNADIVGSTWGVAYDKKAKLTYLSTFLKRQAGLGDRGLDGIYVVNQALATPALAGGFDLEGVIPSNGGAAISFGSVTRVLVASGNGAALNELSASRTNASRDDDAFAKVGKVGYGDIDIDQANNTLWAVNLNERSLVAVDISSSLQNATVPNTVASAKVRRYFINGTTTPFITGLPSCPSGTMRPFGLKIHNGVGYLGVVCDGASLSSVDMTASQQAYVLSFNPLAPTAFTQVTSVPLNYNREQGWIPFSPTSTFDALESDKWQRWNDTYTDPTVTGSSAPATDFYKTGINGAFVAAPQPILADIEFLANGDMVLGFIDRFAHQQGWSNFIPGSSLTTRSAVSQGDVLLASYTGSGYTFEGPNENDNFTTPLVAANAQSGQSLADGPSGAGEFFYQDYFIGSDATHPETALGGLAVLPGSNELTAVSFDPAAFNSMGIRWFNASVGNQSRAYTIVANTTIANFGKGSALGDVELLCNQAPIEIGNRVWIDSDNDGIQDPGEPVLAGVRVLLTGPGVPANTTVITNASGEYYFSNATGTNTTGFVYSLTGLTSGGSYSLTFPTSASAGTLLLSSKLNSASGTNADAIDTDPNSAGVLTFTLGDSGENNFSYDAAYFAPVCDITLKPTVSGCYNTTAGSRAMVSVEVAWADAPASGTISVTMGGQTRTIVAGTFSVTYTPSTSGNQVIVTPQVVAFEVPADGSTQTIQAFFGTSYAVSTCKDQATVTLPVACPPTVCVAASGQTGGTVFNDYDADGIKDASETIGQQGITVKAYDCLGNLVGTAITDNSGAYSFTSLTAASYPIRVEFSNIPALLGQGTVNGTDGGTTTQFVPAASCSVDLGVLNPNDYCQASPEIIIPCFTYGDPLPTGSASGLIDALVSFDYGTSGPKDMTKITTLALAKTTGTTWGVAYDKYRKKAYTSATPKRHAGLGPLGLGGIYVTDMASGTTTGFVNVTALGINVGSSTAADPWFGVTNSNRGLTTLPSDPSTDPKSFSLIGKVGIGDIDISEDGNSLYFVNLYDKKLYQLNITGATPTLTASYAIPDPGCTDGNFRPFAMKIYRNEIYVGSICDASIGQDKSNMRAYVHKFKGGSFSATPVFDFPLTYPKGYVANQKASIVGWYPWTDDFADLITNSVADGNAYRLIYPQPIFTGIAFDLDGSMVLAFGDRTGLQTGYKNKSVTDAETTTIKLYDGNAGGDILRAAFTNGTYILENNAKIPSLSGAGVGNNQGPGFGEFYNDNLYGSSTDISHAEIAFGGLGLKPGSGQIVIGSMDPINIYEGGSYNAGGIRYLNNTTGQAPTGSAQGFILYQSIGTQATGNNGSFAKATGLGDIAIACDLPTYLQIGNRVWSDVNKDGVQDPCEPPLANVVVSLYQNGTLVTTTLTNASGEYYFTYSPTSSTVTGSTTALTPNTAYQIVFGNTQFANSMLTVGGNSYVLTQANSTTTNANDQNDSDATINTVAGITAPAISLTTGAAGSVNHTYDVGFVQTASLGDYVFLDANKDGQQNTGDTPIPGVRVTLLASGTVVASTTTDANGLYSFTGLTPGVPYSVSFTAPAGYSATTQNSGNDVTDSDGNPATGLTGIYSLTAGENNITVDMGYYIPSASLGDYTFIDTNKNGIQDAGDVALPGVIVTLYQNGSAVATTTTNASGLYSFTGLAPGTANSYVVGFTAPAGYTATLSNVGSDTADSDADPITGKTQSVTLAPGEYNPTLDAGFYLPTAGLGDYVFEDKNANGIQDAGDLPIPGVLVTLYTNGSAIASTTTNANGLYSFTGLTPATPYVVGFGKPAGYVPTLVNVGNDALDSDAALATGLTGVYSLTADEFNPTVDAGFYKLASLGDYVFNDKNRDGIQNAGDSPIPGVTVTLYQNGSAVATTTTDVNGLYSFTGLTPGTSNSYVVGFTPPSGYSATSPLSGTDATKDSNADPITGRTSALTLASGENNPTIDAGFYQPTASLGNFVFEDVNKDGLQDAGDIPIAGAVVTLLQSGTLAGTTTTDANGIYSFTGLTPGIPYSVSFTTPVGFSAATTSNVGSNDAIDSDPVGGVTAPVTLTAGENNPTLDAGFVKAPTPLASLGNFVFEDVNKDGLQDAGDIPIAGAVVTLLQSGTVAGTTTTNASGIYSFTGLTPGIPYSVSFTTPVGFSAATASNVGSNDAIDSDPVGGVTAPVTLTAGENNPTLDAGFVRPASLPATFALAKTVNKKRIEKGGIVTYTISVTNTSAVTATNVLITDAFSTTGLTIVGSATTSAGTFIPSLTGGSWSIPTLAASQTATISFLAQANEEGLAYNVVTAPDGTTASACLTVPFHVCANESFEFELQAPNSFSVYQWSLNGTPIPGATSATLSVTAVGEYTVATTNAAGCPDGSCCPFVVVADPAPSLTARAVAASCNGSLPLNDASITLVGSSTNAVSYNITLGSSFTASAPLFATNQPLAGVVGGVLKAGLANPVLAPGDTYTIRVYSAEGCFSDTLVVVPPAQCQCPPVKCAPFVVKKVSRR